MRNLGKEPALFWFRRDLRVTDNAGLYLSLFSSPAVYCVFVFDREILDQLPSPYDRRVEFIHESVLELKLSLQEMGGDLIVRYGRADEIIPALALELKVEAVYCNRDYEPAALARDQRVRKALAPPDIELTACKDTVLFEGRDIRTETGGNFKVFTPYRRAWLAKFYTREVPSFLIGEYEAKLAKPSPKLAGKVPTLEAMGFERTNLKALGILTGETGARRLLEDFLDRIKEYDHARDFPAVKGVSYLSVHNRFGTISIRELVSAAGAHAQYGPNPGAETWLSELIWREFYFQILSHNPHVVHSAFKPVFDGLQWSNDPALFAAWCEARTGYPLVDAAMRQINQTGYMHNRLRMVVASFLTKDLLIDYRWGEKYFADHLNDFDLAANNGGWQWAASTGCDAQPFFRIFNPVLQSQRFDPEGKFIRKYLPELVRVPDKYIHAPSTMPERVRKESGFVPGTDYPLPIINHTVQREKALALFKALNVGEAADAAGETTE